MGKKFVWYLGISLFFAWEPLRATDSNHLVINEIQVANIDRYIDPSYDYGGWIELYNPGDQAVSLAGMIVRHTDSEDLVEDYTLTSSHGSVAAKGYRCLWFDHNSQDGYFGANASTQIRYKLDADGGRIALLNASGSVVSEVTYPEAIARCSYLRKTDGGSVWAWTSEPTPAATNNKAPFASKRLDAPQVDTEAKVFTSSFTFNVSIPDQTTLYYTTDGSTPVPGECAVSKDGKFTVDQTSIYRFLLARSGYLSSPVVTRSFILNEGGYYLPIVSISTAPDNLFGSKIGVYVYGTNGRVANNSGKKANQNMDWDRPVNFEYLVPDQSGNYVSQLNQEVSLSVFGGYSRFSGGNDEWETRSSFKLKAEKQYEGVNELSYPFFGSKPNIKLKSILVRNGGGDQSGRVKDAGLQEIIRTSGIYIDCQACQPAQVFLNGKYLGMLNLRDESNKRYAYSNYGIEADELDQWEKDVTIKVGDANQLNKWFSLCAQLAKSPASESLWQQISDNVDIDEYCNYMALESYMGNYDWYREEDTFNNIKGFRARTDNGKFHFVLYDLDCSFGQSDMLTRLLQSTKSKTAKAFINMLKYEPFEKRFVDAYCLADGSVFESTRTKALLEGLAGTMEAAMQLEGGSAKARAQSLSYKISNTANREERKNVLMEAFGLTDEYDIKLSSSVETGHRLLLNDMEIPTGKFDGYLFAPIKLTAVAPAGYRFESWKVDGKVFSKDSILYLSDKKAAGTYTVVAQFKADGTSVTAPIRINEVSAGNDIFINDYYKKEDFIELYNTTSQDFDLAGCYLSDKADNPLKYKIEKGTDVSAIIPANGYRIVWCDKKGSYTQLHASFKLDNQDGACVLLTAPDGSWSDCLTYKKQERWHTCGRFPDGGNGLALLHVSSIGNANHICFDTELWADSSQTRGISSYQLSISDAEWATVCLPFAFAVPAGLKVYKVSGLESDGVHVALQAVSSPAANQPYLVNGAAGTYSLSGAYVQGDGNPVNGLLTGTFIDTYAPVGTYVLQKLNGVLGFYLVSKANSMPVSAYHAYLSVDGIDHQAPLRIPDATEAIRTLSDDIHAASSRFSLFGQPLYSTPSGFYIESGRPRITGK